MKPNNIYSGAPVRLTTLANGAVTNAEAQEKLARTSYLEPVADEIAPGVTVFGGDSFVNTTLIEGPEGLVVYDTGEVLADGELLLRRIRARSAAPIVAVIYSHSHYVQGTTALVGDGKGVRIIGHPRVNENIATGGSGSLFPETAPLQIGRTLQQFNHYVPASGVDAPAGANLRFGRSGYLPVDTAVEHGQRLRIAGLEMQFFTRYGSDTDDCLTVYLPERGVVLNNLLWPFLPNIYTLRGSKLRDPREWRDGLKLIRDLEPEALANTHARAIRGHAAVREVLDTVIDGLGALLDQTLRGILRGLGPDELRDFVRLPQALADAPHLAEIYGELSHFGPYIHNAALGWFDGRATTIDALSPSERARRLVDAMGGVDAVLARTKSALEAHDFAWAGELAEHVLRIDPKHAGARALAAEALLAMARVTPAHTTRSWMVSQARALRGEIAIPRLVFANTRILALAPPFESMDQFRVRIDPDRAGNLEMVVALTITDRDARHAWHLRRGVVETVADVGRCRRPPDVEIATDYENWLRFFSCKRRPEEFLAASRVLTGSAGEARLFFAAFDYFGPGDNDQLVPVGSR
jgi:alkyl sulfatase BDS1-like metallo-beta-lactamase superfamily hydrolase